MWQKFSKYDQILVLFIDIVKSLFALVLIIICAFFFGEGVHDFSTHYLDLLLQGMKDWLKPKRIFLILFWNFGRPDLPPINFTGCVKDAAIIWIHDAILFILLRLTRNTCSVWKEQSFWICFFKTKSHTQGEGREYMHSFIHSFT